MINYGQHYLDKKDIDAVNNVLKKKFLTQGNEIEKFPHPRSSDALKAISQKWGSVAGFKNAEAFTLIRQLRK